MFAERFGKAGKVVGFSFGDVRKGHGIVRVAFCLAGRAMISRNDQFDIGKFSYFFEEFFVDEFNHAFFVDGLVVVSCDVDFFKVDVIMIIVSFTNSVDARADGFFQSFVEVVVHVGCAHWRIGEWDDGHACAFRDAYFKWHADDCGPSFFLREVR